MDRLCKNRWMDGWMNGWMDGWVTRIRRQSKEKKNVLYGNTGTISYNLKANINEIVKWKATAYYNMK